MLVLREQATRVVAQLSVAPTNPMPILISHYAMVTGRVVSHQEEPWTDGALLGTANETEVMVGPQPDEICRRITNITLSNPNAQQDITFTLKGVTQRLGEFIFIQAPLREVDVLQYTTESGWSAVILRGTATP